MRSSFTLCISMVVVLLVALTANLCDAGEATKPRKPRRRKQAYVPELKDPLAYGNEFVEVTEHNTFRRRYHDLDYEKDLAFYMKEAKANAKLHEPNTMKMLMVFCKDIRVTSEELKDENGDPVSGVNSASDEVIKNAPADLQQMADLVFAYSRGAIKVEWQIEVIKETLHHNTAAKAPKTGWWFNPTSIVDELMEPLAKYKDAGIDFMFFHCGAAIVDEDTRFNIVHGGMAWSEGWIYGARTLTVSKTKLQLVTHEWLHHIVDINIVRIEGLQLWRMHASGVLGFGKNDLGWAGHLAAYTVRVRYFYPRDMWRRWDLHKEPGPKEPFTDKAYAWDDVKYDCWLKLPELGNAELAQLTGLKTLEIVPTPKESYTFFKVAPDETLASPRTDDAKPEDASLNNVIAFTRESAAVLHTKTGHWLFVKPDLANLYVDMPRFHKGTYSPLPVYGYVLEGFKPLIVIKAPASLKVPANELGYFKK